MARKAGSKKTPDAPPLTSEDPKVKKREHDLTDTENVPEKKARRSNNQPPRSPLPKRHGRNEDPIGKRAKAVKVAATKATKEAKAAEKQRKTAEAEAAKEKLAQMEADESFVQTQERQLRVRRKSDMKTSTNNESDDSEGDAGLNGGGEESENDSTDDGKGKKRTKKNKKPQPKLQDRVTAIDSGEELENNGADDDEGKKRAEKIAIDSGEESENNGGNDDNQRKKRGGDKKKKTQPKLRDQVATKKDRIKGERRVRGIQDNPVASGLNVTWMKTQKSKKSTVGATAKMDDEAALSTRPNFPPSPKFDRKAANAQLAKANLNKRNPSRINKLVAPVPENGDNSDSDSAPSIAVVPTTSQGKQTAKPVDQGTNKACQHKKPARRGSDASNPTLDSPPDPGRAAIMPKGGNSLNLLPTILSSMKAEYFATLYSALYASEEPFDHFVKTSPTFLKISRRAFESVWPRLKITVETNDVLFNIGYQRILEKRGKIHDAVKASVDHHFQSQLHSTTDIVKWVKWFCSTYGSPVFYETPVPLDGPWDANDPNYKKPRGFLKSKFLISIGSRFLQDTRDTAFDFGPPRDFVTLLGAQEGSLQYEKVVRSYRTGVYAPTSDFRAKSCNTWVRQYNKNFNKTDGWWKDILEYYINAPDSEDEKVGDLSILDEARAALPMSSP